MSHRPTIRPYRTLTPLERDRTLGAYGALLEAAQQARRGGWLRHERDPLIAAARKLGVVLWPALADRITREAVETTAAP